jgi:rRNA maturation protein Nop10
MRSELWPFRPAPFADELLTSWIARLAHGHGLRPACFLEIIQPACSDFAALDWTSDPELSAVFAMRTDVPRPVIESLVLRFNPDPNLRHLLHHNWQGTTLQYCAACLAEGVPYFRRCWRLACVRVCPRHQTRLRDTCPHCGSMLRLEDLPPSTCGLGLCQNCGNTLGISPPERGAILESALLRKLIDVQQRIARHLT